MKNKKTTFSVILVAFITLLLFIIVRAEDNYWSTNGPYNCRVVTIAVHPYNSQVIYIGTVENGIYKTNNGGESWVHIDNDILPTNIRKIVIHPGGPDTMYAATLMGLYKSSDAGETWAVVLLPCGWQFEVMTFAIHPVDHSIMLVAGPRLQGIGYRTTDGGQTWVELDIPPAPLRKFTIDPINQNIIYALTSNAGYRRTIFKSEDYGETWLNIHNDLDTTTYAKAFEIDPVETNLLYIGGLDWDETTGRCLYKSADGGNHWDDITPTGLHKNHVLDILVLPFDHNVIYICTEANGVIRSNDGGISWEEINTGLSIRLINNIVYDTLTGYFYLGTIWDGIYRSINDCESWEKISYNIPNTYCIDYALDTGNPGVQIICAPSGLYRTCDGALNWEHIDILYPNYSAWPGCVLIDRFDSDIMVVGLSPNYWSSDQACIIRSADGGGSWESIYEGFPYSTGYYKVRQASYENESRRYYLATYTGLYISDDTGISWSSASNGLPEESFFSLGVSEANPDYVFAGGYNLYRTLDGGETWHILSIPPGGGYIEEIVCDPINTNIVYLSKILGRIYRSWDTGQTWQDITNNLPFDTDYMRFTGVAINPFNPDNIFVNSHHYGIFQSHNGGETWVPFNEGLNTHYSAGHTIIDPADTSRVYLATSSQSVWSITRTPTVIDDDITLPMTFSVSNYPNPFNASTNIKFTLPNSSDVKIDIYDMLGRRVSTIVNEHLFAGYHSVIWNPQSLGSGAYFYRIEAGEFEISKKMILLK